MNYSQQRRRIRRIWTCGVSHHRFSLAFLCVFSLALSADCAPTLVSQVLRGRIFGSHTSNEISRRIVVDDDGFLYIAGTTAPDKPDENAWGDVEAGEMTGNGDIFVAKFSPSAELVWTKRTGSSGDEVLNDLKLASSSLYICGSTGGDFGGPSQGSMDGFIMKFTLDGDKAWRHPYQFGTELHDSCNALEVDANMKKVAIVGTTGGRLYGTIEPRSGKSEQFIALFDEFDDSVGLKFVAGQQTNPSENSSGDALAFAGNHVLMMTTEWDENLSDEDERKTYLNVLDRNTLSLQKRYNMKSMDESSFHGLRMIAPNGTEDVYIVGKTKMRNATEVYHAIMFNAAADEGEGGVVWATRVGRVSKNATMVHQTPSIAVDPVERMVYVAGVEDGFFLDPSTVNKSGIVVVPFLKIRASSGRIDQSWRRSTTMPTEREELTDIALGPGKQVVYTGVWEGGSNFHLNALIGALGSPRQTSRESGSIPVATSASALAGGQDNESNAGITRGKVLAFILLGLGVAGIILTALIARGIWSPRKENDEGRSIASSDMEEIRRQIADAHRDLENPKDEKDDLIVGGSAGPH